jgi:hypothetical protein
MIQRQKGWQQEDLTLTLGKFLHLSENEDEKLLNSHMKHLAKHF